jgi:hypothetical protein
MVSYVSAVSKSDPVFLENILRLSEQEELPASLRMTVVILYSD